MKRSNIIFILLFVLLYAVPFFVWAAYAGLGYRSYTGISDKYQVVRIDNPDLAASQVIIDTQRTSSFPEKELMDVTRRSYLYYKGKKHFLPETSVYSDTIHIGKPRDTESKDLTLNIHMGNLKTVLLNGQVIWEK